MAYISLENVSVTFPVFNANAKSLLHRVTRRQTGGELIASRKLVIVQALKNINLQLNKGDRVGLIGHNGAGKSTLLKLMAGIYEPASGFLQIKGNVSSLFNLTAGMAIEQTGKENIYLRGLMLGLTQATIAEQYDQVAEFTGLGDYLLMPLRTYSAGMLVRLAFALATWITPDILLVDEVFGAGDKNFIEQARQRMELLFQDSRIVVFSSHGLASIREFCNKTIWLEGGRVKLFSETDQVLDAYLNTQNKEVV